MTESVTSMGTFESELATVCSAIFDGPDGSFEADEMRLLKELGVAGGGEAEQKRMLDVPAILTHADE